VCQRWIGVPDRKVSVATYDLDDVKVRWTGSMILAIAPTACSATHRNGELNVEMPLRKELTAQTVPISIEEPALAA
jgi:hypothetical protein